MSGFGLSAFFFSTIAHTAFSDDTSAFLLVLALGTTIPMIIALFIVRIVPQDDSDELGSETEYMIIGDESNEGNDPLRGRGERLSNPLDLSSDSHVQQPRGGTKGSERLRSLSLASLSVEAPEFGSVVPPPHQHRHHLARESEEIEESTLSGDQPTNSRRSEPKFEANPTSATDSFMGLLSSGDFWLMFAIVSLCEYADIQSRSIFTDCSHVVSGTGLMCKP